MLIDETNEDVNTWKDIVFMDQKTHSKNTNFSRLYVNLMEFLSKSQQIFVDMDNIILKFVWKDEGVRITKTILIKVNKLEESIYPISRLRIQLQ